MNGSKNKKLGSVLEEVRNILKDYCAENGEDYKRIAILLVSQILNIDKTLAILEKNLTIEEEDSQRIISAAKKYTMDFPLQYCTNKAYFMGLEFYVDENVLIPRFDTETLIEVAIELFNRKENLNFLDIGTGSGCIAIALCKFLDCKVIAVDISENALRVAEKNAKLNGVFDKIHFVKSNLFENIPPSLKFDAIFSNPPYISENEISMLDKRVLKEPKQALFSKENGLYYFQEIAKNARQYLKKGGYIIFEVGYRQSQHVKKILKDLGYVDIKSKNDLNNIERCVYATLG
ncbi:peptide chain release factor N(5)-glutamine methyltransferase [Caldicellulosiruptor sp. F32]|uniref:peptide chain release factor N(5)-glutamine methyltransferase n=1 Tax=Caldicellulosiruptor sp. F32 TaxID=1214564 RepID=UPI000399D753|nr:peptide chain release factor N(5)-glutamine methyltransferase [Caldicellulosiruptor sp. F32]